MIFKLYYLYLKLNSVYIYHHKHINFNLILQHHSNCNSHTVAALGPTSIIILLTMVCIIANVALAIWVVRLKKKLKQYKAVSNAASDGTNRPQGTTMCNCKQNSSNQHAINSTSQVLADNVNNVSSVHSTSSTLPSESRHAHRGPFVFPGVRGEQVDCSDRASITNRTRYKY